MNSEYKETFRQAIDTKNYYKNKQDELEVQRQTWTRKPQLFESTYKSDILSVTNKK